MLKINYPVKKPAIKMEKGGEKVFCIVRKRWLKLTPEEWVRQNFLLYLVEVLHYPVSLIAVEKQLLLGDLKKRFDIVLYDRLSKPSIIVECKEMDEPLSEKTLLQVLRYNRNIQAELIIITNGSHCYVFKNNGEQFEETNVIPQFSDKKTS